MVLVCNAAPAARGFPTQHRSALQRPAGLRAAGAAPLLPRAIAQPGMSGEVPPENRKVAIFVEPSPFSHVSGMKNRFECLIQGLREEGDDVTVFTPDRTPPKEFHGAQVIPVLGFKLPFYSAPTLLLGVGLSLRVLWTLITQRPDVIHTSCPGPLCIAACLYAKLLSIPLVVSYHTHIPHYIPRYTWSGLVTPMWALIRWFTRMSDVLLVTSKAMKDELANVGGARGKSIDVWQRGVDTNVFNPKFRCNDMRAEMSDGHPEAPLIVHVGRLGAEKNLYVLKDILEKIPNARLAFVGDGPERQGLEKHFAGTNTKFMGMTRGERLSQAYASADVFLMPSESETLGFVVLEAMASGVPVVAVSEGGLTDIITRPGETGLMYKSGDYDHAAELTQQLIDDKELNARVGAAGRADVEKWGWSAATNKLRTDQYRLAIEKNRAAQRFSWLMIRVRAVRILRALIELPLLPIMLLLKAVGLLAPKEPEMPPTAA